MIETNEYQTQVTDELLSKYSDEIKEKFIEIINTVPFVKRLINKDRKYARDCERDEDGKIIVDITNPHILEDMDYFRPSAIYFKQHGCYTKLKPNSNPNSEYGRWLREEVRRCWYGYVRESDGEWIPGLLYFYVNYCPIIVSTVDEKNSKVAYREEDFPSLWDGVYWRFHYLDQARKRGHHAIELARRGCGKSFSLASIMARNFILGENEKARKRFHTILTAYQNEYLSPSKDGTLGKFVPIIDFIAKHTQFPRRRLVDSKQKMTWQMGYKDVNTGVEMGTLNDVMGVSSKDDEAKLRGKRGYILVEEMGCHIKGTEVLMYDNTIKKVEDINIGDELIGKDGTKRIVQEKYNGTDMLYKITLSNGDWHIVNSRHPIYYIKHDWNKDEDVEMLSTAPELLGKKLDGCYIPKATLSFSHKDVCVDPYFLGLWLGDGFSDSAAIGSGDIEVIDWLSSKYDGKKRQCSNTDKCWVYRTKKSSGLLDGLRKYNLLKNKHIPNDYIYNDRDTWLQLLAGLIDSDGNLFVNAHSMNYEIIQHPDRKKVLDVAKFIATNLGLRCTMSKKNNNHGLGDDTFYRLRISGDISIIPTKVKHKQAPALEKKYKSRRDWSNYTFKVDEYRRDEFYGFTIDKDHLFVLKDLTITHNTFKNLHSVYNTVRYGVEDGDSTFGMIYLVGTANEDANDFTAAKTLLYSPKAYNIYELDNVYDKINQGKPKFGFFFPSYVSRLGCIDKNGNSDVVKALLEILTKREEAKYSIDPNTILRVIAEMPITPAEAIIKAGQNIFPIAQLTERLGQIDSDPTFYDKAYVGNLVLRDGGEVKFVPSADKVIRDFPHEDNKGMEGAIEIYNLPEKDSNGKVYRGRYICGCDTYDDDASHTTSLGSILVMDLWTDSIVAEYTGRPLFADDFYEICRLIGLFYCATINYENNKKGLFAYFSRMNCTYLLCDTLEFLRDKMLVKEAGFGNTAKGTIATLPINNYARSLTRAWLLQAESITTIDEQGEEHITTLPRLYKLKNRALIQELINYNDEGNFDRISSIGMLMLLREDRLILGSGSFRHEEQIDEFTKDPFFQSFDKALSKLNNTNNNGMLRLGLR